MNCTYESFKIMTDELLVNYRESKVNTNEITERIRAFFAEGGADGILQKLFVGLQITTKASSGPSELVSKRFIWLAGPRKDITLSVEEAISLGMFLPGGPYHAYLNEK